MSKQTAVEWLVEKLMKGEFINNTDELVDQAKAMEREQIIDAFIDGEESEYQYHVNAETKLDAVTYYNQTYKGGEQ